MSRLTQDTAIIITTCSYGIITLYNQLFQIVPIHCYDKCRGPTTPYMPKHIRFGLFSFRSPLLRESMFLSFPADTKMFQFSAVALLAERHIFNMSGCPIRISADQFTFANPRSFSQLTTSFLAGRSLGIPRSPFCNFF